MSTPSSPQVKAEWAYSGKALRMECVKNAIITVSVCIVGIVIGLISKTFVWMSGMVMLVFWLGILCFLAGFWAVFVFRFLSKTKIRYFLTADRLEMIHGSTKKAMDLVQIEDLTLEQSTMDKIVNGGVGTVVASAAGKGNASKIYVLKLEGVEDPQDVFDTVNQARIAVRKQHGVATVRGVER